MTSSSPRLLFFSLGLAPVAIAGGCGSAGDSGAGAGGSTATPIVHPIFGATKTQATPPPPISGGTLLIAKSGEAVAADSDRDAVYVVDLKSHAVTTISLQAGDEPGRLVEDDNGRVAVVLRSGGAVATIDLASKTLVARRSVCVAPRGIAYDSADASLYIACASGELVQLAAAGGPALRTLQLDRDLRDVIVRPATILVTRFRSAETLAVGKQDWTVDTRWQPPSGPAGRKASVAWRTLSDPVSGGVLMLHQRAAASADTPLGTSAGAYYGPPPSPLVPCQTAVVEGALSLSTDDTGTQVITSEPLSAAVVPVDVATSAELGKIAIAAPGNAFTPGYQSVLLFDYGSTIHPLAASQCLFPNVTPQPTGQPVAVAFTHAGTSSELVVQIREPAALFLPGSLRTIPLSKINRDDTGQDIFHSNAGANIACASCHPEGGDDGRVWTFTTLGDRRTPSLRGTVQGTAPYHWGGELSDFPSLVDEVFRSRMLGPVLSTDQVGALSGWINRIPAPVAPPPVDPAAANRGQVLFDGPAGCSGCHGAAKFTNNQTVNVGTGQAFQVPSLLGLAYRAPFMHNGCAATLKDRFANQQCGGGNGHGNTAVLSGADVSDLIVYLATL